MNHITSIGSQKSGEIDSTLDEPHDTRARSPTKKDRLNTRRCELGSLRRFTRLISRLVDNDEPDDMTTRLQFTTQIDRKSLGPAGPQVADNLRDHHFESPTDKGQYLRNRPTNTPHESSMWVATVNARSGIFLAWIAA
jgi:hypothetical protein